MTHFERMTRRAIKATATERDRCLARVTDLTAYIRALEESLEQEDIPTRPDNPTITINGAAPDNQAARIR